MINISGIGKIKENLFFTSDTFFDSDKILKDINRPWNDSQEMTDDIIEEWNSVVNKRDIVYHLGNFYDGNDKQRINYILSRLNGRINLIVGENDNNGNILSFRNKLASVNYRLDIKVNQWDISLSHYPFRFWYKMDRGSWHLHGCTLGEVPPQPLALSMDVGVDMNEFKPYTFEEIESIMIEKHKYYNIQRERISHGITL